MFLLAFLDDVYIKTTRTRARAAFDTTTDALLRMAQIDTNLGKCRAYGRTPEAAPQDMLTLGPDVWRSDAPAVERGVKVLGTPIGSPEFVQAHLATRLADEQVLLDRLAVLPDAAEMPSVLGSSSCTVPPLALITSCALCPLLR